MARNYKISVSYYLNKRFKPVICEGVEKYPLYYYITIRRRTINKPFLDEPLYLSENEFQKIMNCDYSDFDGSTSIREIQHNILKDNKTAILEICKIFINDYESNSVDKSLKGIAKRGFTSKDEFTNDLNSYIAFYQQEINDLLNEYSNLLACNGLAQSLKNKMNLSTLNDSTIFEVAANMLKIIDKDEKPYTIEAISKNLDGDTLAIYYFSEVLQVMNGKEPIYFIYQWKNPNTKTEIINRIFEDTTVENVTHAKQRLKLTREKIEKIIVPVLDKILSPQYQLAQRLKH